MPRGERVVFTKEQLAGSRLRCLMMTSGSVAQVAARLTDLMRPYGRVLTDKRRWMPGGFLAKGEAQLGKTEMSLSDAEKDGVVSWWLRRTRGRPTPKWDIVSECRVHGRPGLLLVEAKAHLGELTVKDRCRSTTAENIPHIAGAVSKASDSLGAGWSLTATKCYELCNRFAWSWKLASMKIPVILVYLGFLNADEMPKPFKSADEWGRAVRKYAKGTVPEKAWDGEPIPTSGVPFRALIRAVDVKFEVTKASVGR